LANRLSAIPHNRVLLLEAGPRDWNPWIHIPVGYFKTMHDPKLDWCYRTQPDPGSRYASDAELLEAARQHSQTIYHPTSTCKMGQDDSAVVDARLKVHGIEKLRIADASIMPEIISGNTNAPTIMIGEKAADMILQEN